MQFLALSDPTPWSPEFTVGILALLLIAGLALWRAVRWLLVGPSGPDPWDAETAAAVSEQDATPLCHRCLSANEPEADFCAECGAAVGQYTNWLPYPYIFSLGHTLRIGMAGEFRHSPLTVLGFLVLAGAEYTLFAPVYWFLFVRNLERRNKKEAGSGSNDDGGSESPG